MTHQTTRMQGNYDFRCYFYLLQKMYTGLLTEVSGFCSEGRILVKLLDAKQR